MTSTIFPEGFRLERLGKPNPRKKFSCNHKLVDDWLRNRALKHQEKHLSISKVLLDESNTITGYYTLATGQVDFGDLPPEIAKGLPRLTLPVAVLAWLGIDTSQQGRGLGKRLQAQALRDCYDAGQTFAFIAVIIDCVDDATKAFYQHYNFAELPGHSYRLFLSFRQLEAMRQPL